MKYIVTINTKEYEVEVEKTEAKLISVKQAQEPIPTSQPTKVEQSVSNSISIGGEGEAMPSPMPGTVNGVKKQVGDYVKKGDVVIILEAMKMENEISTIKEGVIKQIIDKGASVSAGDTLFVIG